MNYPPYNRTVRRDEDPSYWEINAPDCMDDCYLCLCGGHALLKEAKTDSARLECSNLRCGRRTNNGIRYIEDMVFDWNQSIREDQCEAHSWIAHPEEDLPCKRVFRCAHCNAKMIL